MYNLFNHQSYTHYPITRYGEWDFIKKSYHLELKNIEEYYHTRVYAVRIQHFLCRLIQQLYIPASYSTERFADIALTRSKDITRTFGLTSEITYGRLFNGIFYGPESREVIFSETPYFDPIYAEKHWTAISAVNVVLHEKSDMNLLLPNGRTTSYEGGLSAISINIPLLALQFRCFDRQQQLRTDGIGLNVNHFVHMYVLPNMLYRQTDLVILNRLINLYYGAPMGKGLLHHRFPIRTYEDKVDKVLVHVIDLLKNRTMKYEHMLKSIPAISEQDMSDVLLMPDMALTRQVNWAWMLVRLKVMVFLIDIGGEQGIRYNRTELNTYQRSLRRLRQENVFSSVLPIDMLYDVNLMIDKIMSL